MTSLSGPEMSGPWKHLLIEDQTPTSGSGRGLALKFQEHRWNGIPVRAWSWDPGPSAHALPSKASVTGRVCGVGTEPTVVLWHWEHLTQPRAVGTGAVGGATGGSPRRGNTPWGFLAEGTSSLGNSNPLPQKILRSSTWAKLWHPHWRKIFFSWKRNGVLAALDFKHNLHLRGLTQRSTQWSLNPGVLPTFLPWGCGRWGCPRTPSVLNATIICVIGEMWSWCGPETPANMVHMNQTWVRLHDWCKWGAIFGASCHVGDLWFCTALHWTYFMYLTLCMFMYENVCSMGGKMKTPK